MRVCHHCGNYNAGWPVRCRYCGAGLEGRMCPRHHVNPIDSRIAFCGECGQPLERTWGAGPATRVYVLALLVSAVTFAVALLPIVFGKEAPMLRGLISFLILVVGLRLAVSILPPGGRRVLLALWSGVGRILSMVFFGTGNKGRG
ncbi:MAG: zinc ribbon domain-containing protein [Acidobacteriota bacterium]|nr:zinc ribbon domain-containing protein [Acidobacteriota bacterium]